MNIKGTLPLLILHVLSNGPNHGYQINKIIQEQSDESLNFKEGTLYPTLHKLERNGHVRSEFKKVDNRRRRYYEITSSGLKKLDEDRRYWEQYVTAVNKVLDAAPP